MSKLTPLLQHDGMLVGHSKFSQIVCTDIRTRPQLIMLLMA